MMTTDIMTQYQTIKENPLLCQVYNLYSLDTGQKYYSSIFILYYLNAFIKYHGMRLFIQLLVIFSNLPKQNSILKMTVFSYMNSGIMTLQ